MRRRFYFHLPIVLALLGLVAWWAETWHWQKAFSDFAVGAAVGAVFLNVPIALLLALRTYFIIKELGYSASLLSLVPITVVGLVVGALTPAYAGDLLRTPFFRRQYAIPVSQGSAIVVYERAYSFIVIALTTGALAVSLVMLESELVQLATLGAVALLSLLPSLLAPTLFSLAKALKRMAERGNLLPHRVLGGLVAPMENFIETAGQLLSIVHLNALVTVTSIAIFAAMAGQLWLVASSLGLELGASEAWLALGTSLIAGMLSLLPLGLGSSDATLAVILTRYGSQQAAASSAILLRVVYNVPLALVAAIFYLLLQFRTAGPAVAEASPTSSMPEKGPGSLSSRS